MAFVNLDFAVGVDGSPGMPDGWTLLQVSSVEEYAGYDAGTYELPWETFGVGWDVDNWARELTSSEAAEFSVLLEPDPPKFESFGKGWFNDTWTAALVLSTAAEYGTLLSTVEGFELEWDNEDWSTDLESADAAPTEDFEDGWLNDAWTTLLGSTEAASYGGADPATVESFESFMAPVVVSVDPSSDTLTAPDHPLTDGMLVRWRSEGTTPSGLSPSLDYYVVSATTNTFQLAATSGGSAVGISDQGGGTHRVIPDPSLYWSEELTT